LGIELSERKFRLPLILLIPLNWFLVILYFLQKSFIILFILTLIFYTFTFIF
jgi:hypothetical protein